MRDRRRGSALDRPHGFTLVEALAALAIACLMAAMAAASFSTAVHTARRADGIAALAAVQAAEDRYRAAHTAYGTLADVGIPAASPAGHYRLALTSPTAAGYSASAEAINAQAGDAPCRWLRLATSGGDVVQSSGPDSAAGNDAAGNRQCWRS